MRETFAIEVSRPQSVDDLDAIRQEASDRAYTEAVLDLVRQGKVSAACGARLLGIPHVDFVERLRQHGIPMADYTAQELHQEVDEAVQDFTE